MAKGMPKDTLFKTTAKKSPKQKVIKSASKQVPATTRQTYYVPLDLHKRMKILSIQRNVNLSELMVEGVENVLKKYMA